MKIVITSGPSSGKSSLIREISARGYRTIPEAARLYLNQKISEGLNVEEIRGTEEFQNNLINLNKQMEEKIIRSSETIFMDRSLADNIGYMRFKDMEVPQSLFEECKDRYDYVFILEQLPFEDDHVRNEAPEEAKEIHNEIRQAYLDLGYSPILIPVIPIDERADVIFNHIDLNNNPIEY